MARRGSNHTLSFPRPLFELTTTTLTRLGLTRPHARITRDGLRPLGHALSPHSNSNILSRLGHQDHVVCNRAFYASRQLVQHLLFDGLDVTIHNGLLNLDNPTQDPATKSAMVLGVVCCQWSGWGYSTGLTLHKRYHHDCCWLRLSVLALSHTSEHILHTHKWSLVMLPPVM